MNIISWINDTGGEQTGSVKVICFKSYKIVEHKQRLEIKEQNLILNENNYLSIGFLMIVRDLLYLLCELQCKEMKVDRDG